MPDENLRASEGGVTCVCKGRQTLKPKTPMILNYFSYFQYRGPTANSAVRNVTTKERGWGIEKLY